MAAFCFHAVVTEAGRCLESSACEKKRTAAKEISVDSGGFIRTRWHFHTVKTSLKILVVGKHGSTAVQTDFSSTMLHTSQLAKVRKRCRGASSCNFASQPAIKQKKTKKELALSDLSDGSVRPLTFPVLLLRGLLLDTSYLIGQIWGKVPSGPSG